MNGTLEAEVKTGLGSQEFWINLLDTAPEPVVSVELNFHASGIIKPASGEDRTRYLAECQQKGVIPFSEASFEYDSNKDCFYVPWDFWSLSLPRLGQSHDKDTLYAAMTGILRGFKIHKLKFEVEKSGCCFDPEKASKSLIDLWLPEILAEDYRPESGGFSLRAPNVRVFKDGYMEAAEIDFEKGYTHLDTGEMLYDEPKRAEKFLTWFRGHVCDTKTGQRFFTF